jgi:hypothetical protein
VLVVLPCQGGGCAGEPLHEVPELPGLDAVHLGRRWRGRESGPGTAPRLGWRFSHGPERRIVAGDPRHGMRLVQLVH